jgi:hypothetical protein
MTPAFPWTIRNGIRKDIPGNTTKVTQPRAVLISVKRYEANATKISHTVLPIDPRSKASLRTPSKKLSSLSYERFNEQKARPSAGSGD